MPDCKILDLLLKGNSVIKEIPSNNPDDVMWLEISLQDDLKPTYSFRRDHYARVEPNFFNSCPIEKAKFKLRESAFIRSDLEQGFDPSYERVGQFFYLNSLAELEDYLKNRNLDLDRFQSVSEVELYPL
ncbi:hypothetical protein [Xylocopilactobacillus apis]|uniref:Uncharacterized protein n=1 Tax=Xylocopilactobacillus apis TaxID=2932183 RepID=A0AAU9DQC1_9LACO|nr:hypothetical protein [Xylocopilactobacillus apis]BDR55773.1 hypothetical protein KIMC2_03350 [Xylocopilactobacillus apis]